MWSLMGKTQNSNRSSNSNSNPNSSGHHCPSASSPAADASRPVAGKRDFAHRRLGKEFLELSTQTVPNLRLITTSPTAPAPPVGSQSSSNFGSSLLLGGAGGATTRFAVKWIVEISGAHGTLYEGEVFSLRFRFPERYPMDSPEVVFIGTPPIHPHVYSNGHICLSILYDGWSPALGVKSICLSLVSMLSSCEKKEKPTDDTQYVSLCGPKVSPKSMHW